MSEIKRIARLLEHTFEGRAYHGPSVLEAPEGVAAETALLKPRWSVHSIWELVAHLTAELNYAHDVIAGTAGPRVEGETAWPAIAETSDVAWQNWFPQKACWGSICQFVQVEDFKPSIILSPDKDLKSVFDGFF